jgi:hypothetical protein
VRRHSFKLQYLHSVVQPSMAAGQVLSIWFIHFFLDEKTNQKNQVLSSSLAD